MTTDTARPLPTARSTVEGAPLRPEALRRLDAWWRAANYLSTSAHAREQLKNKLIEHRMYVRTHGEDMPEIRERQWSGRRGEGPVDTTDDAPLHTPEG